MARLIFVKRAKGHVGVISRQPAPAVHLDVIAGLEVRRRFQPVIIGDVGSGRVVLNKKISVFGVKIGDGSFHAHG